MITYRVDAIPLRISTVYTTYPIIQQYNKLPENIQDYLNYKVATVDFKDVPEVERVIIFRQFVESESKNGWILLQTDPTSETEYVMFLFRRGTYMAVPKELNEYFSEN